MVVLFECCRVSDSLMEEFSAALSLEKLKTLPEVEGQMVSALIQVQLLILFINPFSPIQLISM